MKQDGIGREANHKRLLISQNKLRVAGVRGVGKEKVKQDVLGREANHRGLLISRNKLRVAGCWGVVRG